MRHARFDLATLTIEGVPVPLRLGQLLVAEQDGATALQWECLAYGLDAAPIARGRYLVEMATLGGRALRGPAVLVRSVEGAHVLRGDGALDGLDPDELA